MHDSASNAAATGLFGAFILIYVVFIFAVIAFTIYLQWRIATKAGYPGAYSLLALIPGVNLIVIVIFAFAEWPVQRALRAATGGGYTPQSGGGSYIPPGGGGYAPPATMPDQNPYAPPAPPTYGGSPPTYPPQ